MSIVDEVIAWVKGYPEEDQKVLLEDLQQGGCISGMVGPLVNCVDTIAFYEEHKEEINELLVQQEEDLGEPVLKILNGYDKTDPLCLQRQNQNLLTWYGFEEIANQVYAARYEE